MTHSPHAPLGALGPAAVFDALAYGRNPAMRALAAERYDIVAAPGEPLGAAVQPGDVLVLRGLGEGGLASAYVLAGGYLDDIHGVVASGYAPDSLAAGWYAYVEPPAPTSTGLARRVLEPEGRLPLDRMLLRSRPAEVVHARCSCGSTGATGELASEVAAPVCTPAGEPDPTGRGPHPLVLRGSNRPTVGYAQQCLNGWMARYQAGQACVDTSPATRAFIDDALSRLGAAGQLPLVVDCRFGQQTDRATRAFQACKRIDRDGKIGRITWALLKAYDPAVTPVPPTTAVDLLIEPATFVAAVRRAHTAPPRTRLVIRSSAPLTTPVVLNRTSTATGRTIRLFTAATGGTEITFNGTDNLLAGARLTPGLELFAEAVAPSPAPEDFVLTVAHQAGGTAGSQATARGTAVAVALDVGLSRVSSTVEPPALPETEKVSVGRAVQVADASFTHERALVVVRPPQPAGVAVTLVLEPANARVRLFQQEAPAAGQVPLLTPHEISTASIPATGLRLFVDATTPSTAARDTGLRLGIRGVAAEVDRVAITAVQVDMVAAAAAAAPPLTFVRFGLWDQAFDAAGNVRDGLAETANFIGLDHRNFHLRVRDAAAAGRSVAAEWRTLLAGGGDDDAPADRRITLPELSAGGREFTSRAVMLVTDDTDRDLPTNSGLAAPFVTGNRAAGQSDHRTRRARIDGSSRIQYSPQTAVVLGTTLPVFRRTPTDERRRVSVRVIRYTNAGAAGFTVASPAEIAGQFAHANARWNAVGIQIDAQPAVDRPIPAAALDASGGYPGGANSAHEQAALADLIPVTPDRTLTAVFVHSAPNTGFNAYATVFERTPIPVAGGGTVTLGDRSFIFIRPGLDLLNTTLAHELHHVLFNRADSAVDRQFISFNSPASDTFGVPLPDVRIRRRIHNRHAPDPDSDPRNDNVVNWARRTRTTRLPIADGAASPADSTTGNLFHQDF